MLAMYIASLYMMLLMMTTRDYLATYYDTIG